MKRKQFTFYRSYREALRMMNNKDRLALYEAIMDFALDGYISGELTAKQEALFKLVLPNLINGRRKAMKVLSIDEGGDPVDDQALILPSGGCD